MTHDRARIDFSPGRALGRAAAAASRATSPSSLHSARDDTICPA